jgi:7-cyano-7-deazaguanine synthase
MNGQAVVLLSGGMDSVAALCWAKRKYETVVAMMFDYGQPNRDQEIPIGGIIARDLGIERLVLVIADSLPRGAGILQGVVDHDGREDGTSPAFVPGRNLVFLICAASHGALRFPNGAFDVVIGANAQDAKRFPDCRGGAFAKMSETLRHGLGRDITIVAPWIDRTKTQILAELTAEDWPYVARSWSCYRGKGPCGTCSACVLRREALVAHGVDDVCEEILMHGGDHR